MDLYLLISQWERELDKWGRREEVYRQGVAICEKHMPNSRLLRLLIRARKPNSKHWGHLEYQLKKMKPPKSTKASRVDPPAPKKNITVVDPPIKVEVKIDSIEELTSKIRQLATERALLSNQLVDPGEDPLLIEKNCEILDRIEPVMQKMKDLEKKREEIKAGKISPIEDTTEGDRIVVETRTERYTMNELYTMGDAEFQSLKNRVSNNITARKYRNKRYKTEKSRKRGEQELKKFEMMRVLLHKIDVERKSMKLAE